MSWSDYMKNYGYREYPCEAHGCPFCEECYGPDLLSSKTTEKFDGHPKDQEKK